MSDQQRQMNLGVSQRARTVRQIGIMSPRQVLHSDRTDWAVSDCSNCGRIDGEYDRGRAATKVRAAVNRLRVVAQVLTLTSSGRANR